MPLAIDHIEPLAALTVGTGLTRHFPEPLDAKETVASFVATALALAERGEAVPFAILAPDGAIAGSTRLGALSPEHRRAEIGWTFVGRPWQRTPLNSAAKLLLLGYCFERLGCVRVELKTDRLNTVSQAAIRRLGAIEEGTFRRHMRRSDGSYRDTVYFSIVIDEWPAIKARLEGFLAER